MNEQFTAACQELGLTNIDLDAARLSLLRLLEERPDVSQREMSESLNLSLGKTNYLLHALVEKGLLKASNFRRSDHKLRYLYVLTPAGLREKLRLTRRFLRRKEVEFELLRRMIDALRSELGEPALPGDTGEASR